MCAERGQASPARHCKTGVPYAARNVAREYSTLLSFVISTRPLLLAVKQNPALTLFLQALASESGWQASGLGDTVTEEDYKLMMRRHLVKRSYHVKYRRIPDLVVRLLCDFDTYFSFSQPHLLT